MNTFPRPPAQPSSQFSAQILYGGSGDSTFEALKILHLAGPTLTTYSNIQIYLASSSNPRLYTSPFTLASGLNGSTSWNLGQYWYVSLASYHETVPDNLTVSIVSTTQLLFRVTLPGLNPVLPPQFISDGITPLSPTPGTPFTVYAQIVDPELHDGWTYANVSQIPGSGIAAMEKMNYSAVTGLFTFYLKNGASESGTYYIFVNASDGQGQRNTVAVPVVISTGLIPPSSVVLSVSPSPPVNGSAETIYARVTNTGSSPSTVDVSFRAAGTLVGTATGPITAGGTALFSTPWTPTSVGVVLLTAQANVTGGGSPTGALNETVYPNVLFVSHSAVAGTRSTNNTSAYLAQELQAAGFPFTQAFYGCGSFPTAATLEAYDLVIIDFGSASGGTCATSPTTTQQGYITTAMASPYWTQVLLVGADLFSSTGCSAYTTAFFNDFGITGATSGTCFTAATATTTTLTYTANTGSDLLSDGIGTLVLNKTLAGSTGFRPYSYDAKGATNTFLSASGDDLGSYNHEKGAAKGAVIDTDPALIMGSATTPINQTWQTGVAGTEILYNILDYLAGLSTSSTPGHATPDFAISGATLFGNSVSHLSYVCVSLRGNGPTGGLVTAYVTVNGTVALYLGSPVTETVAIPGNGQSTTACLTWEAPGVASYQLAVVAQSFDGALYATMSQLPINVLNQATAFKA